MRLKILLQFAIVFCFVQNAASIPTDEQLNLARAFKLAETGTPVQLRQAVKEGVNFNVEKHLVFDDDDNLLMDDYDYSDFDSATPLHNAASYNPDQESIKYLLSLGLDVNAEATAGNAIHETPLTCAIRNRNNINVIHALLDAGADPEVWSSGNNYSVFHLVASECRDYSYAGSIIVALVKAGGDVNSHYQFSQEEIKDLQAYEDPDDFAVKWSRYDPFGDRVSSLSNASRGNFLSSFTPLMFAVLYNNPEVVNILLDAGADPALRSMEGKTALDYALMLPKTTKLRRSDAFSKLKGKTPPAHR